MDESLASYNWIQNGDITIKKLTCRTEMVGNILGWTVI